MQIHNTAKHHIFAKGGICAVALIASSFAGSQDLDNEYLGDVDALASLLRMNFDLVAIGEFGTPVEVGQDIISLLESREVILPFTVKSVYAGIDEDDGAVRPTDRPGAAPGLGDGVASLALA